MVSFLYEQVKYRQYEILLDKNSTWQLTLRMEFWIFLFFSQEGGLIFIIQTLT